MTEDEFVDRPTEQDTPQPETPVQLPPDWGIQEFLNPPVAGEEGWVKGAIIYDKWAKGRPAIELLFGDCHRVIKLDFTPRYGDRDDIDVQYMIMLRTEKLLGLRHVVNTFVDEALAALETYSERVAETDGETDDH